MLSQMEPPHRAAASPPAVCPCAADCSEELWPPAVMRDNTDALTAALKKHFGISGIYANFNDKRRPGITEWRINSSRVQRITRGGNHNRTIRGSSQIRDQPLLYTHWWLFWAAVHVHKKLFPEDFTEKRIMEKFEAALQEQAGAASPRQSEASACSVAADAFSISQLRVM